MTNNKTASKFTINMQPVGRRIEIPPGKTLLEAAQSAGVELVSLCGGIGACDSCKVRLVSGELAPLTLEERAVFNPEELDSGYRLACQATPLSDVKIDIPPDSLTTPQRLQIEGIDAQVELNPAVIGIDVQLEPPNIYDLRSDVTRLKTALLESGLEAPVSNAGSIAASIAASVLTDLSDKVRQMNWNVRLALLAGQVIAVLPPGTALLGLAVDLGTTKLAAYLVDLTSGATLAKTGTMNPQIAFGEDVISRIGYANSHADGRSLLQSRLVDSLNQMVDEMCTNSGSSPEQIVEAVVVGNTAMHHLFAGFPVQQLGAAPYVPAVSEALDLRAHDLGLRLAPGASVHLPPIIAGYVGADHVAMGLATGIWETRKTAVALDIGTNTEITLAHGGRMLCCSCASGPAFEGAHIQDGMRAAPGAIERVQIDAADIRIQTIGDQPPVGICGSGILDSVAEMICARILDRRGAFQVGHPLVNLSNGRGELILAGAASSGHGRDVRVTRRDVNEIQLAKGAIRAGIDILLAEAGIPAEAIEEFIVAGAFGTYISIRSAIQVGMFPALPLDRFRQVGNAAGTGARQMLVSSQHRHIAKQLANRIEYIELSSHPNFTNKFAQSLFFPDLECIDKESQ
jgi:uncharacterized 2Fe-2S/4Fe-4S cluster protein (DUF4445 family)